MLKRLLILPALALVMSPAVVEQPPLAEAQQPNCVFQLGFKTLHDMIPDIVGDCRENEWHNADNGDGLQQTTGGLLVWRKCDNWTAFTNGSTTWINGPTGLVTRPNQGPLFPFESTSCAPVPVPASEAPATGQGPIISVTPVPAAPTATPVPSDQPPTIDLEVPTDRVDTGETFTIRLKGQDDKGVDSMWWWATDTSDSSLRDTHTFDCHGANPCRQSWDVSTTDTGTMTIHAVARDTAGQQSDEETDDVRVRQAPTPTPTS